MNFEKNLNNSEKQKSKREMINEKQTKVEVLLQKLDQFADKISNPEDREEYSQVLAEIKQLNQEIVKLISEEDLSDVHPDTEQAE